MNWHLENHKKVASGKVEQAIEKIVPVAFSKALWTRSAFEDFVDETEEHLETCEQHVNNEGFMNTKQKHLKNLLTRSEKLKALWTRSKNIWRIY